MTFINENNNNFLYRLTYSFVFSAVYTLCTNVYYYKMIFDFSMDIYIKSIILSFIYAFTMYYGLSMCKYIGKILIFIISITSSIVLYFSITYGVVQNKDMFALIWNTNTHEIMGVFSPQLLLYLAAGMVLGIFSSHFMPKQRPRLLHIGFFLSLLALCAILKPILPVELKGRHPMPFGYLSHFGHAVKQQLRMRNMIAARAPLPGPVERGAGMPEPLYIVLALGESLRADHMGVYGYERNTTPNAAALPLIVFDRCYSAGAGTTESVTRMLTRATIAHPETALTEKSVITLFRQAGFRTVWLTNQGSMATGETWVASIARESEIFRTHPSIYSIGERLEDTDLLPMLDEILAMPPQNTLIVLHSFGSHINPEDRYSDIFRTYAPVCRKFSVSDCTDEELVNSYDNSVLATDFYWAGLVERLKNINSLLIITSDHGDRLRGKYKGHSPELMDNPALRWVPFMLYASPSLRKEESAVRKLSSAESIHMQPISHDMLFHSLLGAASIQTPAYKEELDIFSGKGLPHQDPFVVLTGIEQTAPL